MGGREGSQVNRDVSQHSLDVLGLRESNGVLPLGGARPWWSCGGAGFVKQDAGGPNRFCQNIKYSLRGFGGVRAEPSNLE